MVFDSTELSKCFKKIKVEDFKFKKEKMGYSWIRDSISKTERIVIGFAGYPNSYRIYSPVVEVSFKDVEETLDKFDLGETNVPTISKPLHDIAGVNYELFSTEINSDESFGVVKNVIDSILERGVMPFFQHFANLSEVANFLSDKTVEEIVPYIQGGILLPKTALILKLANHPNFLSRLNEFRGVLINYASKSDKYKVLLEKFEKLFEADLKYTH